MIEKTELEAMCKTGRCNVKKLWTTYSLTKTMTRFPNFMQTQHFLLKFYTATMVCPCI